MYRIWSTKHNKWYLPGEKGYTALAVEAGTYTVEQGHEICKELNWCPDFPVVTMVPV